ncbi:hypothetical protein P152DRAFT_343039 [Eremomyces bilateralis CBS 781.70]|uniref:Uncharacterized protein n=1 Tax=Eremomyces bilateralis CBS 781.70 TaxID=1392243 RepID=A0A6G1G3H7_9PEZI|nr:uncharacterized protein P152DRAFT_343039 [Eremomyces bilateralis CBS 781.70]KAF1812568.1 hypothetical protein P152DRAFT_343039 [Eremomyces bilateralis CBS 781.70]
MSLAHLHRIERSCLFDNSAGEFADDVFLHGVSCDDQAPPASSYLSPFSGGISVRSPASRIELCLSCAARESGTALHPTGIPAFRLCGVGFWYSPFILGYHSLCRKPCPWDDGGMVTGVIGAQKDSEELSSNLCKVTSYRKSSVTPPRDAPRNTFPQALTTTPQLTKNKYSQPLL